MSTQALGNEESSPLRVVVVYQTDPFTEGQGGGARYVRNLLGELRPHCDEVIFFGVGADTICEDGLRFIPITRRVGWYPLFMGRLALRLIFTDLSRCSLVHVHRVYFAIPFLLLKPSLKVVCTLHGRTFSVFRDRFGGRLFALCAPALRAIERFGLKRVDHLVVVSKDVASAFAEKYPRLMAQRRPNTSVIGSMVDLDRFKIGKSKYLQIPYGGQSRYLLFVGRLAAVKDVGFLISYWSEIMQGQQGTRLVLVGDGEDALHLRKMARDLCPDNIPIFHGSISAADVHLLLQSADMLLLCSNHEASPTVIKEALATGLPVVTNDVGDVTDFIVNTRNGFVVRKDICSFAQAIQQIQENPLPREDVLEVSKHLLEECSPKRVAREYLSIYQALVEETSDRTGREESE